MNLIIWTFLLGGMQSYWGVPAPRPSPPAQSKKPYFFAPAAQTNSKNHICSRLRCKNIAKNNFVHSAGARLYCFVAIFCAAGAKTYVCLLFVCAAGTKNCILGWFLLRRRRHKIRIRGAEGPKTPIMQILLGVGLLTSEMNY